MTVTWSRELEIGVAHIDAQHQELFARAAAFLGAADRGEGEGQVLDTLGFLSGYALTHFEAEEDFMRAAGYPDLPAHEREHAGFRATLQDLTMRFARQGLSAHLAAVTGRELVAWLDRHVRATDQALAAWLRGRPRA